MFGIAAGSATLKVAGELALLMPESPGEAAELARTHALARVAEAKLADAVGLAAEFVGGGAGGAPMPAGGQEGPERLQRLGRAWEDARDAWALADAASRVTLDPVAADAVAAITAASAEAPRATEVTVNEAIAQLRTHLVSAAESPLRVAVDALRAQHPWKTKLTDASSWSAVVAGMQYAFLARGEGGGRAR